MKVEAKDMKKIIIVEDDKALNRGVMFALKSPEYEIVQAYNLTEARRLKRDGFDLMLLDINLPDGTGLDLLKEIRQDSDDAVILLTANDMEIDIVTGLELGADDYITKPFSLAVLRARVNTQLRKQEKHSKEVITIDEFQFDFEKMEFRKGDEQIELSKTEQKLLRILVANRGQTISRSDLVDRIWTDGAEYVDENALSVTIKRLRDKLEEYPSKPVYIKNVYGIGYTWAVMNNE